MLRLSCSQFILFIFFIFHIMTVYQCYPEKAIGTLGLANTESQTTVMPLASLETRVPSMQSPYSSNQSGLSYFELTVLTTAPLNTK